VSRPDPPEHTDPLVAPTMQDPLLARTEEVGGVTDPGGPPDLADTTPGPSAGASNTAILVLAFVIVFVVVGSLTAAGLLVAFR
jgi:hypothetical protein